jgi:hypothetical protein
LLFSATQAISLCHNSFASLTTLWKLRMILTPIAPEFSWLAPLPLKQEHTSPLPYPVACLPAIIQNAVLSYQAYGKQPLSLIACSALANISLACQALANVARDKMLVSPVSLYFLSISPSGSRKSSVDHAFGQPIRSWEKKTSEALEPTVRNARELHQAWLGEKEALLAQIRRAAVTGQDATRFKEQLTFLVENEPTVPLVPSLFFEDATQEAITSRLATGWPSASIWSDEGGIVLSGYGMQNNTTKFVALLNRLWDGKDFVSHRKTSRSFVLANRRLTVSLMLQPLLMEQMAAKNQGIVRQSGFLARSLMACPENSMGTRFYEEPPESLVDLQSFHERIIACLDTSLFLDQKGCFEIPALPFASQAKAVWIKQFNDMEAGLSHKGKWALISDFASKAAENTARLAALFHLFDGKDGAINCEDVERATEIVRWHLSDTKRIFLAPKSSKDFQDATKLLHWMMKKAIQRTTPQYLQQYSPLRDKKKRDEAIQILLEYHYLKKFNENNKTWLALNPLA